MAPAASPPPAASTPIPRTRLIGREAERDAARGWLLAEAVPVLTPAGTHMVGRTMHLFRIDGGAIVEQWSAGWEWLESLIEQRGPGASNPLIAG